MQQQIANRLLPRRGRNIAGHRALVAVRAQVIRRLCRVFALCILQKRRPPPQPRVSSPVSSRCGKATGKYTLPPISTARRRMRPTACGSAIKPSDRKACSAMITSGLNWACAGSSTRYSMACLWFKISGFPAHLCLQQLGQIQSAALCPIGCRYCPPVATMPTTDRSTSG